MLYDRLTAMSDEEVIERYDEEARHGRGGVAFCRDEIWRRESARQTAAAIELSRDATEQTATIRRLTWVILALTVFVAILTATNVAAVC